MRRRVTFIQHHDSSFKPDQTDLTSDALSIRNLDAVREDRLSVPVDELPSELVQVLKQCQQLHIRWSSERPRDTLAPFSSRSSPGLHVLFTPSTPEKPTEGLCPLLKRAFGNSLDCSIPEISFTTSPIPRAERSASPVLQFHALVPSLHNLVELVQGELCGTDEGCRSQAALALSADSIDLSYDGMSRALTLSGLCPSPEGGWTEVIRKRGSGADQVEVGLFGCDKAPDLEELKAGGLMVDVGEDEKLKPTLFSFPSRHHPLPGDATYTVSFPPPTGLHPTMTISLPPGSLNRPPVSPEAYCGLYTYLTLPSSVFGDKYQLSTADPLFLQSHNLVALRALSGETDLEAPDWAVPSWGSNWLFEVTTPAGGQSRSDDWNITIPLHLRYLQPSESGYRSSSVPWPVVFWACTAGEETEMSGNPFDRVNLGWDRLFGPQTTFHQLHPSGGEAGRLVEELRVPVLRLNENEDVIRRKTIELGTVAVVTLGLLWVLWKLGLVVRSGGEERRKDKGKKEQ